MTSSSSEMRSKLLGEAFIETIRHSQDFQRFRGLIRELDSVTVSVGSDVFILNGAGLVPIQLTSLNEAEWLSKMGRVA